MKYKKIAIIGGSGFVGTSVSRLFKEKMINHSICDIDVSRPSDILIEMDVENPESLDKLISHDCIINLAAVHRDDVKPISRYDNVNVEGARNVCNAAKKYKINTIIFTSSVAIYGFAPPNTKEDGPANFFNDYGRTKFEAEKIYSDWYYEDPHNRKLIIIRPTVIFGEGNRGNVYNLLNAIFLKKFVMIGKGLNKKSMAYVKNVAAFIEYVLSLDEGKHIFNYIDKPDLNMNELISKTRGILFKKDNVGLRFPVFLGRIAGSLADIFSFFLKKNLPISRIRIEKFISDSMFGSSIKTQTTFKAPHELHEAIEKTIRYEFIEDNSMEQTFETE